MMQKYFIIPIKFLLIGVIAITALFAVSSEVIAGGFVPIAAEVFKEIITKDGKKLCTKVDAKTKCERGVKCRTPFMPLKFTPLAEVLNFKDENGNLVDSKIEVPGQDCSTFDIDNGLPNTRWRCSGGRCYPY